MGEKLRVAIERLILIGLIAFVASLFVANLNRTTSGFTNESFITEMGSLSSGELTIESEDGAILKIDRELSELVKVGYICRFKYTRRKGWELRQVTEVFCDTRYFEGVE